MVFPFNHGLLAPIFIVHGVNIKIPIWFQIRIEIQFFVISITQIAIIGRITQGNRVSKNKR